MCREPIENVQEGEFAHVRQRVLVCRGLRTTSTDIRRPFSFFFCLFRFAYTVAVAFSGHIILCMITRPGFFVVADEPVDIYIIYVCMLRSI